MKNNIKILSILMLFVLITLGAHNIAFAKTEVQTIKSVGNFAMSLSEIEELMGYKSDGTLKVTSPSSGKIYKTGDIIPVKWNYAKNSTEGVDIVLIYEDMMMATGVDTVLSDQEEPGFVVTDRMPSGEYFVLVGIGLFADLTDPTSFDISKSFKIKTKTSQDDVKKTLSQDTQPKAADAVAKANMSNSRAQAELYYDKVGGYQDVCKKQTDVNKGIYASVSAAQKSTGKKSDCDSTAQAWAAEVQLKSSKMYYCVDSTGYAQEQKKSKGSKATICVKQTKNDSNSKSNSGVDKITSRDHFLSGNINSKIKFLTYSDLECPFCKGFDVTVQNLIKEYGDKVAFVYRHYPLTQIHQNAGLAANATECVAKLGNEKKFASYLHEVFKASPDGLNSSTLSNLAVNQGVNKNSFDMCLDQYTYGKEVTKDMASIGNIIETDSMFGTPYSLVYSSDGKSIPIRGNQPYSTIKETLDKLLD